MESSLRLPPYVDIRGPRFAVLLSPWALGCSPVASIGDVRFKEPLRILRRNGFESKTIQRPRGSCACCFPFQQKFLRSHFREKLRCLDAWGRSQGETLRNLLSDYVYRFIQEKLRCLDARSGELLHRSTDLRPSTTGWVSTGNTGIRAPQVPTKRTPSADGFPETGAASAPQVPLKTSLSPQIVEECPRAGATSSACPSGEIVAGHSGQAARIISIHRSIRCRNRRDLVGSVTPS
jgi:hypothetical protein